jgi:hypothetical protein
MIGIERGAEATLAKPFDVTALLGLIGKVLDHRPKPAPQASPR